MKSFKNMRQVVAVASIPLTSLTANAGLFTFYTEYIKIGNGTGDTNTKINSTSEAFLLANEVSSTGSQTLSDGSTRYVAEKVGNTYSEIDLGGDWNDGAYAINNPYPNGSDSGSNFLVTATLMENNERNSICRTV
ncbi:MAG: hypothetical protein JKY12_09645 [Sneathiella sp.]|nr:hypothetical protein [Sneathiella sp.]